MKTFVEGLRRLTLIATSESLVVNQEAGTPVEITLVPDGAVSSAAGDFVLDAEGGRMIEEAFKAIGRDLVIDYEHQTLGERFASPDGTAPAAGWIKSLHYEEKRGIVGLVEWTDRARQLIHAKEYKYLSPVVVVRKKDRKAIALHSAAVTNAPAIRRMEALAAKDNPFTWEMNAMGDMPEGGEVTSDQLIGELAATLRQKGVNLPDGAGRDAVIKAAIAKLTGGGDADEGDTASAEVAASARKELDLPEDAGKEQIVLAINRLKDSSTTSAEMVKLRTKLATVEEDLAERGAKELVERFVQANKINPQNAKVMTVAHAWAKKDPKAFTEYYEAVDPLIPAGRVTVPHGDYPPTPSAHEEEMVANALKEHGGNHGEALVALQSRLLNEECERSGLTRARAAAVLEKQYPKIFGAAA